jgi:hypothetical protein
MKKKPKEKNNQGKSQAERIKICSLLADVLWQINEEKKKP